MSTEIKNLMDFIDASPTAFQAVENSIEILKANHFKELSLNELWKVEENGKYYINYLSSVIAFRIDSLRDGFQIIASHTDSPALAIKPNPVISSQGCITLNTEVYGGPILNTWFDRPLSIAGRVVLKSDDILKPIHRNINFKEPVAILPNLAIHLNREVNKGYEINKQKELLPIISLNGEEADKDFLLDKIASFINVQKEDILDFDLFLYEASPACLVGFEQELIQAPRLDNLEMLQASLSALVLGEGQKGIKVVIGFDNEEVGSLSKTGADSTILKDFIDRLSLALHISEEEKMINIAKSFMISADAAHAVHPNHSEKHDITNKPLLSRGPVIKLSNNKRYTTDAYSKAIFVSLCEKAGVPYQEFVNHSNQAGGSTIGPISSSHLSVQSVDIGAPMLAMHSTRELIAAKDHIYMLKVFEEFLAL